MLPWQHRIMRYGNTGDTVTHTAQCVESLFQNNSASQQRKEGLWCHGYFNRWLFRHIIPIGAFWLIHVLIEVEHVVQGSPREGNLLTPWLQPFESLVNTSGSIFGTLWYDRRKNSQGKESLEWQRRDNLNSGTCAMTIAGVQHMQYSYVMKLWNSSPHTSQRS